MAKQIVSAITYSVTKATSSIFSGAVDGMKRGVEAVGEKIKGLFGK